MVKTAEANGLERGSVMDYRRILRMHIAPFIGSTKLSDLSVPLVRALEDQLRENGRSTAMVRVRRTRNMLSMLLSDALERGLATRNVARGLRANRTRGKERQQERRHKGKLKVGIDIPAPDEIRVIVSHLTGRWRPLLLTAIFWGLRASELRGLRWIDIDLARPARASCSAKGGPLQDDRCAQVRVGRAHRSDAAVRRERAQGMAARVSEERVGLGLPKPVRSRRGLQQHRA
jgi:integrase